MSGTLCYTKYHKVPTQLVEMFYATILSVSYKQWNMGVVGKGRSWTFF